MQLGISLKTEINEIHLTQNPTVYLNKIVGRGVRGLFPVLLVEEADMCHLLFTCPDKKEETLGLDSPSILT